MDFIQTHVWIFWIALILIFVIIEVLTVDFTFLMLAVGSAGGLVSGLFPIPWGVQIVIAGVLSLLLLFTVRPPLLRILKRGGDKTRSNVDALLGQAGVVVEDFTGAPTAVKLANGETWTAKAASHPDLPLHAGDRVIVTSIDGATAFVTPAERPPHE